MGILNSKVLPALVLLGHLSLFVVAGGSLSLAGCGPGEPKTYPVKGMVNLDGKPLTEGDILFLPDDPSLGPDAGKISDGKFAFRAKAGPKRVEIHTSRAEIIKTAMGETQVWKEYLPASYNTQTILKADVQPQDNNDFTFELKSAGEK